MSVHLEIDNVSKTFQVGSHQVQALREVSLQVTRGECLAVVGESGSGKSTLANLILGIHAASSGTIRLDGTALPDTRGPEHRRRIQLVQQNPLSALNPRRRIGASLRLPLDVYDIGPKAGRAARVGELLQEVGLPADFAHRKPSALSGGQRQRVAIARALACGSEIVVLDEPTSALDVLVQARVLTLLDRLRRDRGLTFVFITHDLSVVRNIADRVAIFEKGRLVETGPTEQVFTAPASDYTRRLIGAVPVVSDAEARLRDKLLETSK
ncbi:ATP-binding cassette domain-containing protein [Pseudooceanicola sp. CBS1P-1]|uniref:ATP-binding cassette domain-containing protein n=1 Tax=Pseudooceanicola albus TaxID=2692189 RepID=A0A6L7G681_9RHOB|nr:MULTISPECIES: ATP-binding cassette domain-containing protein [Pseudooceanicola]MBT9385311.1 ATP-binding cassette domain-containing protein [Pseudooceanicola endophyticus]MXN18830.1 ATP-binding cassette domain-containing protein [Pseudooceanicola albus]